ncbi:hypothetical protein FD754_002512 [Muntiacus muntjak]|uniref:10 kDa heat shock protein, mitochondrial n=1 Tax=Muntiacus muntjak TaxID=9888 RepID=A0A5N3WDI1_MUNMU|nr:hypothetical protein FD754_002512 [Muntiacus muntjak]
MSTTETVTRGGIMLPGKSQGKVLQATVVVLEIKLEIILPPEYGGTKVVLDSKDYFLFRDDDILGK